MHEILVDGQHGFRKRRSCETQLILTTDDLAAEIDAGGQTDIILLDFAKAFDKVPHQRLLMTLDHYGIRGKTLKWIACFLADRSQQVVVEGQMSATGAVLSGVPQGSVIGPTLFLIFINDLCNDVNATVRLFADDTALYSQVATQADADRLQADLTKLGEWVRTWQMEYNVGKCLILTVTNKKTTIKATYTLHDQALTRVDSAKYLGLEFTNSLHWGKHAHAVAAKANRASAFLYRNIRDCPRNVQTRCYKSLARPMLEYASTVWSPYQQGLINDIEMVQRRAARRILRDYRTTTSATALVNQLGLHQLETRRNNNKAALMYKIMNGLVDVTPRTGVIVPTSRRTRGQEGKLLVPYSRTNTMLHSFFPSAIRIWNSLPPAIASSASIDDFKAAMEYWSQT